MRKVLVQSNVYYSDKEKCNLAIKEVINNSDVSDFVIITDLENIELDEEEKCDFSIGDFLIEEVNSEEINENSIIVLNCSGKIKSEIVELIDKLKRNLLLTEHEVETLIILCDKLEFPFFMDIIRNTFTIKAINFEEYEMHKKEKSLNRRAVIAKYGNDGIILRMVRKVHGKFKRIIQKLV